MGAGLHVLSRPSSGEFTGASTANVVLFALLAFAPIAPALKSVMEFPPLWVFLTAAIAMAVLAVWVRRATKQLANYAGPTIGGLLNISFGSIAELALALFVLASGRAPIVRAQITGWILGTNLFGLGSQFSSPAQCARAKPFGWNAPACCQAF